MIQEFLNIFLPVGKFILASVLMVIFYQLLYREKSTFNYCRIYLLSIAFVSILISQFQIEIYTPPVTIIEVKSTQSIVSKTSDVVDRNPTFKVNSVTEQPLRINQQIKANEYARFLTAGNIVFTIYGLVTIILFVLLFIQLYTILLLKRRGRMSVVDGFQTVVSDEISTPFSFYKSIFLNTKLTGFKQEMILSHEQFHIKHRHYLDVFIIELVVRILWFNPVLWWVRKELRNVSEFQADRSVLNGGHDLYKYQTIILEEVMEYNPYLTNGFNNSFTKKRFIMMKNNYRLVYSTLRRALIFPFFLLVFSLLSFTVGKSEVRYIEAANNPQNLLKVDTTSVQIDTIVSDVIASDESNLLENDTITQTLRNGTKFTYEVDESMTNERWDKTLTDFSNQCGTVAIKLRKLAMNYKSSTLKAGLIDALNTNGLLQIDKNFFTEKVISKISKSDLLESASSYAEAKRQVDILRLQKSKSAKSAGFQPIVMSLIQDKLVSMIMNEVLLAQVPQLQSTLSSLIGSLASTAKQSISAFDNSSIMTKQVEAAPNQETSDQVEGNKERDSRIFKNAYLVKPEQTRVSKIDYDWNHPNQVKIVGIETKKETRVTLAVPISGPSWWISFDRGFVLIDKMTNDCYKVRRLENELPLSKIMIVKGKSNKMVEVTLVFPALKKSVESVDLVENISDDVELPSNDGGPLIISDVKISNYKNIPQGKTYR